MAQVSPALRCRCQRGAMAARTTPSATGRRRQSLSALSLRAVACITAVCSAQHPLSIKYAPR
jgi:hypothetical protein